jgi:hypothetical protein
VTPVGERETNYGQINDGANDCYLHANKEGQQNKESCDGNRFLTCRSLSSAQAMCSAAQS